MKANTLKICVLAMGIALFVALSVCLQVPVFENYYLCLGYLMMKYLAVLIDGKNGNMINSIKR